MDKTFKTKDAMIMCFDRDTNQVYFFLWTPKVLLVKIVCCSLTLSPKWCLKPLWFIAMLKSICLFGPPFFFFGSLIPLIQMLLNAYSWALVTGWTWSGRTPSVSQGFESSHHYFFFNLLFYINSKRQFVNGVLYIRTYCELNFLIFSI